MGAGGGEQVEEVLLAFHAGRIGILISSGRAGQLVYQVVDVLAAHPGRATGQAVAQFPFPVAFAAATVAVLDGDAAADLGETWLANCTRWK